MTESSASFNNFFSTGRQFGLNVKPSSHEHTFKEFKKVAVDTAAKSVNPFLDYLATNDAVFSGEVKNQINSVMAQKFSTEILLNKADEDVNGPRASFDMNF